jgi:hypothetical protein
MDSKSGTFKERRKYPRAGFDETITVYKVVESKSGNVYEIQGNPLVIKAKDVSEGGMRLQFINEDKNNKILKLSFQIPNDGKVEVCSKLVWAKDGHSGLEFIVLDEEVRRNIRNFVGKNSKS